ncbi:MAG: hypothetical protein OQL28_03575 [Sedimenticola sp.]|nr:hypothetical protein [Sedimenticola sp.]
MFYFWVVLLALLLFLPVSNLVWVGSVRRLQRKLHRQLNTDELQGQKRRARFISLLLVLPFSWLFNLYLVGGGRG